MSPYPVPALGRYCIDNQPSARARAATHQEAGRLLRQFLVRVICDCGLVTWRGGNKTMLGVQRTPSVAKLSEPAKHKELDYVYAGRKKRRSL